MLTARYGQRFRKLVATAMLVAFFPATLDGWWLIANAQEPKFEKRDPLDKYRVLPWRTFEEFQENVHALPWKQSERI